MSTGQSLEKEVEIRMEQILEPSQPVRQRVTEEGLEELSKSMARRGLINAITVRRKGSSFEVVAGNRRYLAAKALGWAKIRSKVKEATDEDARLERIHENLHREDMSPIEEGKAIRAVLDEGGYTKGDVAKMCSKSESWVNGRLDLLGMPEYLQEAVDVGAISVSAARELNAITDDEARRYYVDYAIKQGATAVLCAFWRGRWEVERVTNDPSALGAGAFALGPPPPEPELYCFWCDRSVPIRLLNHIRCCPSCTNYLATVKAEMIIQAREDEKKAGEKLLGIPGPGV